MLDDSEERELRRCLFPNVSDDEVERGVRYCFLLNSVGDSSGVILANPGTLRWHYGRDPLTADFVLLEGDAREILRIHRRTRLPPRFDIIQMGAIIGTISLRSLLFNKYTLALNAGPTWNFRMPLFTTLFRGESSTNSRVWVRVGPSKSKWNVLMEAEAEDVRILAGLAFIHRQWWCYS